MEQTIYKLFATMCGVTFVQGVIRYERIHFIHSLTNFQNFK